MEDMRQVIIDITAKDLREAVRESEGMEEGIIQQNAQRVWDDWHQLCLSKGYLCLPPTPERPWPGVVKIMDQESGKTPECAGAWNGDQATDGDHGIGRE